VYRRDGIFLYPPNSFEPALLIETYLKSPLDPIVGNKALQAISGKAHFATVNTDRLHLMDAALIKGNEAICG
jgi:hypothetical protein